MQLTVDAKDARKLARNLEKYFKSKGVAVTHGRAMEALAHMLGARDGNALIALLDKSSAQDHEFEEMVQGVSKGLRKPFTVYVSASSKSEEACEPRWAKIVLTRERWATITRRADLVRRERLLRAVDFDDPELWSCESPHAEEDHSVQLSKILVSEDRFWYSGWIGDIEVETKEIWFCTLAEAINGPKKKGLAYMRSDQMLLCEEDHMRTDLRDMLIEDGELEESSDVA